LFFVGFFVEFVVGFFVTRELSPNVILSIGIKK
jgi:hypothetical protein